MILAGTTVAAVLKTHRFLDLARELPSCEPLTKRGPAPGDDEKTT